MTESLPPGAPPKPSRAVQVSLRRTLYALAILAVLLVSGVFALRVPAVGTTVANVALGRFRIVPGAALSVRQASGDWLTHLELNGLRLAGGGTTYVTIDSLRSRHELWSLLSGQLRIHSLELSGVTVDPRTFTQPRPPSARPRPRLTLDDMLRGRFYGGPKLSVESIALRDVRGAGSAPETSLLAGVADSTVRLMSVRLEARDLTLGGGFAFVLDSLELRLRPARGQGGAATVTMHAALQDGRLDVSDSRLASPSSDVRFSGEIGYAEADTLPNVWLKLAAEPLDLADLSAFIGASDSARGFEGQLRAEADLQGRSLDSVSGRVAAQLGRGRIAGLGLEQLRLDATLELGRAEVVLDAAVESAPAEVRGWLRPLDAQPAYELRATTPRLPARLAGLGWWPALARRSPFAITLEVRGHGYAAVVADIEGSARGEAGALELEGRIDRSSGTSWEVRRLALTDLDVARLAGSTAESSVSGVVRASGERGPGTRQRVSLSLELDASRYARWSADAGRVLAAFDERGGGASLDLRSDQGSLRVDTLTWRMDGASPFRMRGAHLVVRDLAASAGAAALTGTLEASAELEGSGLARFFKPDAGTRALRSGGVRARAKLTVAPSTFRGRTVRGGEFGLELERGQLAIEGGLDSDAGRVAIEASSRPFDDVPSHRLRRLRFDDLDLSAWSGSAALRSRLGGTLTAEVRGYPADRRAGGEPPRGDADLRLDRAYLGPLAYERGEWRATLRGQDAHLQGQLETIGGVVGMKADVLGAGDVTRAHAELEIPFAVLPPLLGRDSLRTDGALSLRLETTGNLLDPRALRASGSMRGRGSVERARVDSLLLGFQLERGMVTLDTLAMRSNVASLRASGRVALTDPPEGGPAEAVARLHAEMQLLDPSRLAPLLGADTLSVASGTLVLDVTGPARNREVALQSELRTLVWNGLRVKRAGANARGRIGDGGRLLESSARADAEWVSLSGLRIPSARAELTGDARQVNWSGRATLRDRDSLDLKGTLRPDSNGWTLSLERLDLVADSARWHLANATRLTVHEQRFRIDRFEAVSAHGRILANGVLDRAGSQDLKVEVRDMGLGLLASARGFGDLGGRLSGSLDVTGPASAPHAKGGLRATIEQLGRSAGAAGADFDWTKDGFSLSSAFTSPERDSIVLSGHVPIAFTLVPKPPGEPAKPRISGGRAEIRLRAGRFPLRTLQPLLGAAGVGAIDGMLDMDVRLTGRGSEFKGDGAAAVAGGRLELPGLGEKFSDLRLRAAWNGDRFVLQEFHSLAGKGRLDASGSVRVASLVRAEPDLTVKADRAVLMDTKELKIVASGDLHVGGSLADPVLRGRLSFGGSHLLIAPETLGDPSAKATVPLSPDDLRMLEETFTYIEPVTPSPLLGLYEASDLDLNILLDRNNWVKQTAEPRISVEVFGEVRMVKKPHGEPQLIGRLEPLPGRGYLEQFGRSFAFTGGEVLLNGPMSAHRLDIRAQYPSERDAMSREENDVVVHLDLEGTLDKMRLVLSSEPALSETEIITFIATGRSPTTRSSSSGNLGSDAVSLGVDMGLAKVSGALEDVAQRSVGLDVLKVGYDGIQGTTLIAGRYVAPQLYVGFRQPLQTMNDSGTNLDEDTDTKVEMEYAAYRWLVLNVQGESSFIRTYLRFRREY